MYFTPAIDLDPLGTLDGEEIIDNEYPIESIHRERISGLISSRIGKGYGEKFPNEIAILDGRFCGMIRIENGSGETISLACYDHRIEVSCGEKGYWYSIPVPDISVLLIRGLPKDVSQKILDVIDI